MSGQDVQKNVVFVRGLNLQTAEKELREEVEKYGEVIKCDLILESMTGKSRGFAFVTMNTAAEAQEVIKQLHGSEFGGKVLHAELSNNSLRRQPRSEGGRSSGGPVRHGFPLDVSPYERPPPLTFIPPLGYPDDVFARSTFFDPRIPPIISPLARPFYDVPLLPHTQPLYRSYPVPILPTISGQREIPHHHHQLSHKSDTDSYRPKIDPSRLSRSNEKSYRPPIDHYKPEFKSDHRSSSYRRSPDRISHHGSDHKYASDKYASDKYASDKYASDKYASDKYASDKYASDKYASDKYASDKYASDKYASDKYASDKYASDKYASDKYASDKYASDKYALDHKYASDKYLDHKYTSDHKYAPDHKYASDYKYVDKSSSYGSPDHKYVPVDQKPSSYASERKLSSYGSDKYIPEKSYGSRDPTYSSSDHKSSKPLMQSEIHRREPEQRRPESNRPTETRRQESHRPTENHRPTESNYRSESTRGRGGHRPSDVERHKPTEDRYKPNRY